MCHLIPLWHSFFFSSETVILLQHPAMAGLLYKFGWISLMHATRTDWQSKFWSPSAFFFCHKFDRKKNSNQIIHAFIYMAALHDNDDCCSIHHIDIHCALCISLRYVFVSMQKHKQRSQQHHESACYYIMLFRKMTNGNCNNEIALWIWIGPSTKACRQLQCVCAPLNKTAYSV